MKFLSLKLLAFCMVLPPVLLILTVEAMQRLYVEPYLAPVFAEEIQNIIIGDERPLMSGSISLKEAVSRHINIYLDHLLFRQLGGQVSVSVITREGTILYPPIFDVEADHMIAPDPVQTASRNLELMNEGLVVRVDPRLGYLTPLAILILAFFFAISFLVIYFHFRKGLRRARQEEAEKNREIERLVDLEHHHSDRLSTLRQDHASLNRDIEKMKQSLEKERVQASRNEDEMVEEIIQLENRIRENLERQDVQQNEILDLKEKIAQLEKRKGGSSKREWNLIQKRFRTLYKHLIIHERSVDGFVTLEDDMKIKVEEVIHQLNQDAALVTIKRKVFGKKGRETVLEVVFGYKGRLYFRKMKDGRIEILSIGTKNTQNKDLDFLSRL